MPAILAGAALFAVPLLLAVPVYRGLEGVFVDDPMPTAGDLAKLAAESTEYLVTLASAVLGLFWLLMSDKVTELNDRLRPRWRAVAVAGALSCAASLWTGFVALQVILQASADAVVRFALGWVKWLHFVQLVEIATGFALLGSSVLSTILRPLPTVPATGGIEEETAA
ncbi:MAG TPA: hypothetical protein VFH69_01805 [Gemmatimonadota bacterium]|nr:hypothetical protein [Gemmatimonadota bacterium]